MFVRPLQMLALGALIAAGAASEAAACCGYCAAPCGAAVPVVAVGPLPPVYVVNQGPVYSGPSIITYLCERGLPFSLVCRARLLRACSLWPLSPALPAPA